MKKSFWKGAKFSGLLLVGGLFLTGCQTSHKSSIAATNTTQSGNRFAIGDQVTVKFSGTTDQNLKDHEERVTENGTITLPHIGSVSAVGKTAGELQTEIHDRYVPDYYKYLTVTVMGEQRVYYVGGRVRTPGRQFYIGAVTVTKAIQIRRRFRRFRRSTQSCADPREWRNFQSRLYQSCRGSIP